MGWQPIADHLRRSRSVVRAKLLPSKRSSASGCRTILQYLLRNVQDPGGVLFPWPQFDKRRYDASIELAFCTVSSLTIEKSHRVGSSGGGERDLTRCQRHYDSESDFPTWPRLLPICGSSVLTCRNLVRPGNPVLSIIANGHHLPTASHLAHYLLHEFVDRALRASYACAEGSKNCACRATSPKADQRPVARVAVTSPSGRIVVFVRHWPPCWRRSFDRTQRARLAGVDTIITRCPRLMSQIGALHFSI